MNRPHGVIEPIERRHRTTKFTLFGIPVSYTTLSWLAFPFHFLLFLPVAFWQSTKRQPEEVLKRGLRLAYFMHLANYLHGLGHILSSKMIGAPMDELIVTATRHVNYYQGDPSEQSKVAHIGRALGGPVLNLLVGLLAYRLESALDKKAQWLGEFALFNVLFALVSLAPLEGLDGGTILEQFRKE